MSRRFPTRDDELLWVFLHFVKSWKIEHDYLFRRSFRRLLPIPGIFEKIDYTGSYFRLAQAMEAWIKIEAIAAKCELNKPIAENIIKYFEFCGETVLQLQAICRDLSEKAIGRSSYSLREYREAMDRYRDSMAVLKNSPLARVFSDFQSV